MEYELKDKGKTFVLCSDQTLRGEPLQEPIVVYTKGRIALGQGSVAVGVHPDGWWQVVQGTYHHIALVDPFFHSFLENGELMFRQLNLVAACTSLRNLRIVATPDPDFLWMDYDMFRRAIKTAIYQMIAYSHRGLKVYISDDGLKRCWNYETNWMNVASMFHDTIAQKNSNFKNLLQRISNHLLDEMT